MRRRVAGAGPPHDGSTYDGLPGTSVALVRMVGVRHDRPVPDLFARAQSRVTEISRRAVDQVVQDIDFYGQLPADVVAGELMTYMMANVRLYLRLLRDGRLPTDEEMAEPVSAGIRRAQEGVPLSAMLGAYMAAARAALTELQLMAEPEEQEELVLASHHALRYLEKLLPMVSDVYLDENQALYGEEQELHRALTAALISGRPVAQLATRARVSLADAYNVLAFELVSAVDPEAGSTSGTTADVADRRRVRTLAEIITKHLGDRAFSTLESTGGIVLAPACDLKTEPSAAFAAVVDDVDQLLGATTYIGLTLDRAQHQIPVAVGESVRLARLARLLGRPPGVYSLDDLLTEYQLTQPGPARERLIAKVRPLDGNPHLVEALSSVLAHDNIKLAAEELHVHANTLHYRLRRVSELTGLDPAKAGDLRVLAAALIAGQAAAGE
ncbi:MAG: carbohydrate diacid transcriptional activator CdaR [Marmoricola sp.]|nr:carbohydrate diacid transcriptional activator CdaR [Marmoricola sp.]